MPLLQTRYDSGNYEVEDRVNDSISFTRFVGLSLEDTVPDHSVLSCFRSELSSNKAYDKLLNEVNKLAQWKIVKPNKTVVHKNHSAKNFLLAEYEGCICFFVHPIHLT